MNRVKQVVFTSLTHLPHSHHLLKSLWGKLKSALILNPCIYSPYGCVSAFCGRSSMPINEVAKLSSMMISATGSFPFCEAVWRDSRFSCVLKFHKKVQKQGLAGAICQIHPLHPSSQHPNPMDTGLSWTSESTSPIQPCLRGNWAYGCLVCKPSPTLTKVELHLI